MLRSLARATLAIVLTGPACAQTRSGWFGVAPQAIYQTGDSWAEDGVIYRLYGVQSCLRGTRFTNAHGLTRDCGEASLAMLAALTRDLKPQCYDAAELPAAKTVFVFCVATRTAGSGAGSRIDLGTALISTGYAFAALTPDGQPVHPPYFVAQLVAQRAKAGLWVFQDLPEPNAIILHALRASGTEVSANPVGASPFADSDQPRRRP